MYFCKQHIMYPYMNIFWMYMIMMYLTVYKHIVDQFSLPDHMLKTCGLDSRPSQGILAQVCEPLDQPMRYHPFDYVRNKI